MNIQQAKDTVDLSIQKMYVKSSEPEGMYTKYFHFRTTEDYYEKDSGLSGLGEADFVSENATIFADDPVQTYKQIYTQNMVGMIVPFTFQMWKFGIKKRDLENVISELKLGVLRQKERLCAERLENGAGTSYTHYGQAASKTITTTGGDGLAFWTSSHTSESGGSNLNNGVYDGTTYNLPFDYAGLKAAYRTGSLIVDPRGNPSVPNYDTLVCKKWSQVHLKAMEILGAIKKGQIPESFDHDAAGAYPFNIIPLDYLTQSAYWYMFDSKKALTPKEGFQFVESQAPMVDPTNIVYKTKELQTSVTALFDLGANDVTRSWCFSKGDSSVLN